MGRPEIIKLCDFREVPIPDKLLEVKLSGSDFDLALGRAAKRYLDISQTDGPVQKGDIVIADLQSGDSAWQREGEHVNVGLGFAEPALEEALRGMRAGEEKAVEIGGTRVALRVRSIRRRTVPALTDEHVKALGIQGMETVEAYRSYTREQVLKRPKQEKLSALTSYVARQMAARSEFSIPDEAVEERFRQFRGEARLFARAAEDTPEEEFLPAYCAQRLHKKAETVEEALAVLWEAALENTQICTLALYYAREAGREVGPQAYQDYLEEQVREYGGSLEDLKRRVPYERFRIGFLPLFLQQMLADYYQDRLTILED